MKALVTSPTREYEERSVRESLAILVSMLCAFFCHWRADVAARRVARWRARADVFAVARKRSER